MAGNQSAALADRERSGDIREEAARQRTAKAKYDALSDMLEKEWQASGDDEAYQAALKQAYDAYVAEVTGTQPSAPPQGEVEPEGPGFLQELLKRIGNDVAGGG
jgi:hypothetical protein